MLVVRFAFCFFVWRMVSIFACPDFTIMTLLCSFGTTMEIAQDVDPSTTRVSGQCDNDEIDAQK